MEVHMVKSRRISVILSALAVATGALACRDATTPRGFANTGIDGPNFTLAVGFTNTPVGRGNLGTTHVQSNAAGYDVALQAHDNTAIVVADIVLAPGGH